jgi:Glycosyltransferase
VKVGIVSQFFPPEPALIAGSLAEGLAARGHEVRVLTGYPNYPHGTLYPGFRQRWRDVTTNGAITVRRVPLYPSHDDSAVRRAANYLSFAATSTAAAVRFLSDVDVVYVYHPPGTAFAAAALLRLLRRVPVVLHVQDVWPDAISESSLAPGGAAGAGLHRLVAAAMRRVYAAASAIVVISPSMREMLIERGADPAKVRVVLNWTDETLFRPVPATDEARRALGYRGRRVVMHAGNIGPFQNVAVAVRAAAAIEQVAPLDLVLVGGGLEEESTRQLAAQLGAGNVRFLGRREPTEMAPLYAAADFQLVSLRDLPGLRGTIPSKLQAALACGSPVVAAVGGDCARLVERHRVGVAVPPDDWAALADGFARVAHMPAEEVAAMGQRARESYETLMSCRAGIDALEATLAEVAGAPVPRVPVEEALAR